MPIQVLKKTNPFIKGSVFAVLPASLFFIIFALTEIVALSAVALLVLFCGAGIGAYYYSTKTKNKGIEKIGFIIIAIAFYISISSVFLIIIGSAATMLKDKAYTAEINSLISNLERNNKEELLSFKQNKIFLSVENNKRLDQAILKIEQEEAKKAEQDAIERKKQEEAKKVEAAKAEKEAYDKDIEGIRKNLKESGLQEKIEKDIENQIIATQREKDELACKAAYLYTQIAVYAYEEKLTDFSKSDCESYKTLTNEIMNNRKAAEEFELVTTEAIMNKTKLGCLAAFTSNKVKELNRKGSNISLDFKFSKCDTYYSELELD